MMSSDEGKEEIQSAKRFLHFNEDANIMNCGDTAFDSATFSMVSSDLDRVKTIYPTYVKHEMKLSFIG